jgi:hypothetical protein
VNGHVTIVRRDGSPIFVALCRKPPLKLLVATVVMKSVYKLYFRAHLCLMGT